MDYRNIGEGLLLLSSFYRRFTWQEEKKEFSDVELSSERLPLINLKLTFLDILSCYKLPITVAYMYEDRLKKLVGFPEDQQRKELVKIAQEAKRL